MEPIFACVASVARRTIESRVATLLVFVAATKIHSCDSLATRVRDGTVVGRVRLSTDLGAAGTDVRSMKNSYAGQRKRINDIAQRQTPVVPTPELSWISTTGMLVFFPIAQRHRESSSEE